MLRNQSIQAPSDTLPIELVSTPIDWSAYMTVENAFIGFFLIILIPILISESIRDFKYE